MSSQCSTPNIDYKDPDITDEEILGLPVHTDINYTHLEERCSAAASGHRDPRLKFSRKGAIKYENENEKKHIIINES